MTDKPMTPREDVEAITVALEVCAGLNKEACRISNNTIEHTVTMLRALLAERDDAYRRGQGDMRGEAAHHVTRLVVDGCALVDMEFHIKVLPIKETPDA